MSTKTSIPNEWELFANPRYKKENMERAMRSEIERGLVELITNSDDSYLDLEEQGIQTSGKILIEIERKRKPHPTIVIVRDRAMGMSREDLFRKMGTLGGRTSGSEKGKKRRGLHGRGAKDVAAFGTIHFESVKDNEYNHLIIPPSLKCRWEGNKPIRATDEIRKRLGIPKGNGTIVTIEVSNRFNVRQHGKLAEEFPRYYSLRDIFSSPKREVVLVDLSQDRKSKLVYKYPEGKIVYDDEFAIPNYPGAKAHLLIRKHDTPFTQDRSLYREGILVKSGVAIHDCIYFGLDSEPLAWHFTGELRCDFIEQLVREYEDREEENPDAPEHPSENPIRLLDPMRDGLIAEHTFAQQLYKKCSDILRPFIEELKKAEADTKRDVVDEDLTKKLNNLSKEASKLFEDKLRELGEEDSTVTLTDAEIARLGAGLHIIPPGEQNIVVGQSKTFSVMVKHYEAIDPSWMVDITSSNPQAIGVRSSPVPFKQYLEEGTIGRTTFTLEGVKLGAEEYIEVRCGLYSDLLSARVIAPPPPEQIPDGLTFEKPHYTLQILKEKPLTLRLKSNVNHSDETTVELTSDNPDIVIRGGGKCRLRKSNSPNVWTGICRVEGRRLKAKGTITAKVQKLDPAQTGIAVENREPKSGINIKTRPVEDDFGSVRYKWDKPADPFMLLIGAKHPSIRKYLGMPQEGSGYPGVSDPKYHVVLAEVIAEALAFRILEIDFMKKGQGGGLLDYTGTEYYFHKHFSDFLAIAHKHLGADNETAK
ncbi:MAG: hypothetical protein ABIJ39_14450 [Chloroflexota bacterium]